MKRIGLDVGSTTIKCVVLDENNQILFHDYRRHLSKISYMTSMLLDMLAERFGGEKMLLAVSGSAGMGMAHDLSLPFVQEVYATRTAVSKIFPGTDTVIELGGEDAKILFLSGGTEVRMNGTCAGGTGAFIDQMATLMNVSPDEMDDLAAGQEKIYTIASRCGVFAKSDVQPLINQGARKEDIAASIFHAVVNQTVAGLAQGRAIAGNVLYLGGPLTFFPQLRRAFDQTLGVHGTCPEHSLYFVAIGAALSGSEEPISPQALSKKIADYSASSGYNSCPPLFASKAEYDAFAARHAHDSENIREIDTPRERMYLGIDAGSTTIKALLCDDDGNIFRPLYQPNSGNPVPHIKKYLEELYRDFPEIQITSAAVTGYGEDIIKNAFSLDWGVVETVAHYTAAKQFRPDVDFIIDIGGQDIKCFQIRGGVVDNIFLNEACSSGCGSFLQTFAGALGYGIAEFAGLGLFADKPVDLGSRCTVFMNSAVKQAQKDGASVQNISAGLSISVVKNALYKVIRCANADQLGKHIVVQGGTFHNDAVLRAFEQEIGREVIRPSVSGLMGAYGAALYAKKQCGGQGKSTVADAARLASFSHAVKAVTCHGCANHCKLTVNTFDGGRKFIAGNRCEKPLGGDTETEYYDLYEYKNTLLEKYRENKRLPGQPVVGIPMGLNLYELLPFWHTFFTQLGCSVIVSPPSTRKLYVSGQQTIPSDTVCYPAKLLHGHIAALLDQKPDYIFYPCMSYNMDEGKGDNHFNCPVVAYYPRVIQANMKMPADVTFLDDFIGLHDKKQFPPHMKKILDRHFGQDKFSLKQIRRAAQAAYDEYNAYFAAVRAKGEEFLKIAEAQNKTVVVLSGRPYHIDPEISHGISHLICTLGAVVLTEDAVSHLIEPFPVKVLNQWTYHARLYAAAKWVGTQNSRVQLIQLVSFGCGVDAITTDEARSIIEESGKIYTQIKIDEITNTGAVKIRLRSLFTALNN